MNGTEQGKRDDCKNFRGQEQEVCEDINQQRLHARLSAGLEGSACHYSHLQGAHVCWILISTPGQNF